MRKYLNGFKKKKKKILPNKPRNFRVQTKRRISGGFEGIDKRRLFCHLFSDFSFDVFVGENAPVWLLLWWWWCGGGGSGGSG